MNMHILKIGIVLFAVGMAANANGNELADSIRSQGNDALAGITSGFRDSLTSSGPVAVKPGPAAPRTYTVGEAIREQGRQALAAIRWELELEFHRPGLRISAAPEHVEAGHLQTGAESL